MKGYLRGQIANMANVNIETLRYYENNGLIPSPTRSESGYRLYSEEVLTRLAFIKNAKFCGFTLKEIKKALTKSEDISISIADFIAVIDRKIDSINREIAMRENTKLLLSDLKLNLQATDKLPEVQEVLQILNMKS
jgi:DNA-binding transcriptional MerR regulator